MEFHNAFYLSESVLVRDYMNQMGCRADTSWLTEKIQLFEEILGKLLSALHVSNTIQQYLYCTTLHKKSKCPSTCFKLVA